MADPIQCGTLAGHRRHVRRGEPTCEPCRAASAAYMRGRRSKPREPRPCRNCGASFTPARNHYALFCTGRCQGAYAKRQARLRFLTPRPCEWCTVEFTPKHKNARLCSRPCINKMRSLRNLGLSGDQYRTLVGRAGGACEICRTPIGVSNRDRHIDHNHETGAVRGLLCGNCNLMLGHAKDAPSVLRAAADYLEQHTS